MASRRPSHPPSDRLARLLQEARGEAERGGGASVAQHDGRDHGLDEGQDDGWGQDEGWDRHGARDSDDFGQDEEQDLLDTLDGAEPAGRHRQTRVPFLSVPASLRSAQLTVGPRAVRGLLVLAVVALLVLGGRWLWAQRPAEASGVQSVAGPAGEEVEPGAGGAGADVQTDEGGAGAPGEGTGAEEAGTGSPGAEQVGGGSSGAEGDGPENDDALVVHVTGAVEEPGVVELPAGSRVVDAVRAAGGLTDEADQSSVNLARPLVDGEQLWVGRPGETPPEGWSPPAAGDGATGGASAAGAGVDAQPRPLDLNAATQADLEELPGIGPVTAGHILTWRAAHGGFSRVDELLEVSGIGERTLAQLEPLVTVDG